MIRGETVTVVMLTETGRDALNAPVFEETEVEAENVLVAPGDVAEPSEDMRPDGAEIRYTLYFPADFTAALEGAYVCVRGERCRVVGTPAVYTEANLPLGWNTVATVETCHG